jgi:hypothetical protein
MRKAAVKLRMSMSQAISVLAAIMQQVRSQLQAEGIVTAATEAKRGRLFCAKSLLDILEEPARLTAAGPVPATSVPAA